MACRPPPQGNIFPKKQLHCSYLKSDRHLSAKQAAKQAMAIFPFLIPLLYGAIGTLGLQPEQDYVIADVSQGQLCVRKIICLSGISFLRNGFSLRVHFFSLLIFSEEKRARIWLSREVMQEKLPVDKSHMSVYLNSCLLGYSLSLLKIKRKKRK